MFTVQRRGTPKKSQERERERQRVGVMKREKEGTLEKEDTGAIDNLPKQCGQKSKQPSLGFSISESSSKLLQEDMWVAAKCRVIMDEITLRMILTA